MSKHKLALVLSIISGRKNEMTRDDYYELDWHEWMGPMYIGYPVHNSVKKEAESVLLQVLSRVNNEDL